MPASRNKKPWKPSTEQSDFVNYELTKADVAQLKEQFLPKCEPINLINMLVEDGLKITLRWDDRNDCGACWLIPVVPDDVNSGLILSGRGSTCYSALIEASFKHFVLFERAWPRRKDRSGSKSWDE